MATQNEIIRAGEAIKDMVPLGYGMTWEEAKGYAKAALEAAERERAKARAEGQLQAEAEAQGYIDQTCSMCGTLFKAYIHFIRCDTKSCPMASKKEGRTLLQQFIDGPDQPAHG